MKLFNNNKPVEIDMSNIFIHEVKYKDDRCICVLIGRQEDRIRKRHKERLQISNSNDKTYIVAEKSEFEIYDFIVRINKILKRL